MADAAYCSECMGYVWVGLDGGCANGHARSCLRDVHVAAELPTPIGAPPAERTQEPVAREAVPPIENTPADPTFAALGDPLAGAAAEPYGYFMPLPAPVNATNTRNIGVRVVAYLIDFILVGIVQVLIGTGVGFVVGMSALAGGGDPTAMAESGPVTFTLYAIGGIVFFGYFIVMEAAFGYTLGKRVFGLTVVDAQGEPIGWGQSAGRNLMRIVDLLFWGLVGILSMSSSELHQRLGDRVAKTYVVR